MTQTIHDARQASETGVAVKPLAGRIGGDELAQRLQLAIEYDPQPPHNAGSPTTAPPEIVAALRAGSRFAQA